MNLDYVQQKRDEFRALYLAGVAERLFTLEAETCYIMHYGAFGWRTVLFTADGRLIVGKFATTRAHSLAELVAAA